jgi:hypothetical protein
MARRLNWPEAQRIRYGLVTGRNFYLISRPVIFEPEQDPAGWRRRR